jgi:hypothetical protein
MDESPILGNDCDGLAYDTMLPKIHDKSELADLARVHGFNDTRSAGATTRPRQSRDPVRGVASQSGRCATGWRSTQAG